jgi:hypothetical protein
MMKTTLDIAFITWNTTSFGSIYMLRTSRESHEENVNS